MQSFLNLLLMFNTDTPMDFSFSICDANFTMEQQIDNQATLPMSFTAVLPEQSTRHRPADGKMHQSKDQTLPSQRHACQTSVPSPYLSNSQSFRPTMYSFPPSHEKPLPHSPHIATSSNTIPLNTTQFHHLPPHLDHYHPPVHPPFNHVPSHYPYPSFLYHSSFYPVQPQQHPVMYNYLPQQQPRSLPSPLDTVPTIGSLMHITGCLGLIRLVLHSCPMISFCISVNCLS